MHAVGICTLEIGYERIDMHIGIWILALDSSQSKLSFPDSMDNTAAHNTMFWNLNATKARSVTSCVQVLSTVRYVNLQKHRYRILVTLKDSVQSWKFIHSLSDRYRYNSLEKIRREYLEAVTMERVLCSEFRWIGHYGFGVPKSIVLQRACYSVFCFSRNIG